MAQDRTNKLYNLHLLEDVNFTKSPYEMPIIKNDNFIPETLIDFNKIFKTKDYKSGVHFYITDFLFERIWNTPDRYIEPLKKFSCILSPDFSLYREMKEPQKIYNIYRSRLIGAYYQSQGIKVIPTISWSGKESFKYCFDGIEKGSIVSISTNGIMRDYYGRILFEQGIRELLKQVDPSAILIYGCQVNIDFGNAKIIYYNNNNTLWR